MAKKRSYKFCDAGNYAVHTTLDMQYKARFCNDQNYFNLIGCF